MLHPNQTSIYEDVYYFELPRGPANGCTIRATSLHFGILVKSQLTEG